MKYHVHVPVFSLPANYRQIKNGIILSHFQETMHL